MLTESLFVTLLVHLKVALGKGKNHYLVRAMKEMCDTDDGAGPSPPSPLPLNSWQGARPWSGVQSWMYHPGPTQAP